MPTVDSQLSIDFTPSRRLRDYLFYEEPGITLYCGDCLDVLPLLGRCSECFVTDHVVTDPPYGIRKAAWDAEFAIEWLPRAAAITRQTLLVMPGVNNVLKLPASVPPFIYRWMLAVHLTNGMTWIPAMVYSRPGVKLYRLQQDCVDIPIVGDMPEHPSPKPERALTWFLDRLPDGSVLDPFAGSGTTLLAAKTLGRDAIGIEIAPKYCEIAVKRLRQEVLRLSPR
jgi:predicted RNA methylase